MRLTEATATNPSTGESPGAGTLRPLGAREAAGVVGDVLLPVLAGGVIVRRPRAMGLVERTGWDRRGVERVRALRQRHGSGPLPLTVRGRSYALVLDPEDAERVLAGTPEPFSPATREKRGALAQFQPHGVLVSGGSERAARREFVTQVLQTPQPLHDLAGPLTGVVREEAAALLAEAERSGQLRWEEFDAAWWRTVRRVVLGDAARDDVTLTAQLGALRSAANWSLLSPRRKRLRSAFLARVREYVAAAEPGSLAARVAATDAPPGTDRAGQVPHWLFAYDAAGMATARALALLATHPREGERAREEARGGDPAAPRELPYLRGCALESVRLWPTTPLILRESTEETSWPGGTLPAGCVFALYTPYLHRAEPAAPYGDTFAPQQWTARSGRAARANPALVPFSSGPAGCPGQNLVLLTTSTLLAALLERHTYTLASHPGLRPAAPVPATLDHFALRFRVHPDPGSGPR
ncbi:cytochrome P450 [Streptomyces albus subsp. chlorinus]|uniref:cytochrome P450 n=1 Tax=Streptomyces albus TaxID=1888 RepID=UPI00156E0FBB|nr:cytochrome P450 [Streptomyces albus]NSC25004.1 cytochrome P450 [Streptomyces albus subsp. chlorinus]